MLKMYYMFEDGDITINDLNKIKDKLETEELQYFTVVNYNTTSVIFLPQTQDLNETIKLWETSIKDKFQKICEDGGLDAEEEFTIDDVLFIYDICQEHEFDSDFEAWRDYKDVVTPLAELFSYDNLNNRYAAGKFKINKHNQIFYTRIVLEKNVQGE